ncbi:MAG: UDP-3-O-(3-hydroxymyristoyl)glucosamine N-acyltransferase [Terriglobales bacterium]|jgi:UDP-3-O-[3-hydroxymyristoyl] glucosamine N-acyltransferase
MTLSEIARALQGDISGDADVNGIASLKSAGPGDLVYAADPEALDQALKSSASAIIAGEFAREHKPGKPVIIVDNPKLAFARAAKMLVSAKPPAGINPTAIVSPEAKLGKEVFIGPLCVIAGGSIGDGTHIGARSTVAPDVIIGNNCKIHANVTIRSGTTLGNNVEVQSGAVLGSDGFGYVRDEETGSYEKFPQIGRLEIGDDVEIGANVTIDRGALDATVIGRGVKIDNMVHVGHNVTIGENVVIAAQTGISGSVVIEKNAIIAGQVGIADHVRIEEGAILGAQCGVPSNKVIRGKGVVFWGTPARPIREYLKELATLARLAKKK